MRFITYLLLTLPAIFTSSAHAATNEKHEGSCDFPFAFEYAFTVQLFVAKPLPPFAVPGGVELVEPFSGGKSSGPLLNATISGGFAHPSIYLNQTLQVPIIESYGTTADGQAFYIHATGIGPSTAQVSRIELSVGGSKYQALNNGYLLGSININTNRTIVTVQGYLVSNIAKF